LRKDEVSKQPPQVFIEMRMDLAMTAKLLPLSTYAELGCFEHKLLSDKRLGLLLVIVWEENESMRARAHWESL